MISISFYGKGAAISRSSKDKGLLKVFKGSKSS